MDHVVGVRRKRWILVVVVVMVRGTVEADKSLDLFSEARLYWFRRGERQIGCMLPCERAGADLRSIMHSHKKATIPIESLTHFCSATSSINNAFSSCAFAVGCAQ